jgi:tripartite-type tricarboxylate transporter receptor subunit TctC
LEGNDVLQRRITAIGLGLLLTLTVAFGQTDKFPSRPLRIVVPFGAGSSSDANARFLAEKLATSLGQAVYVENKPGASGAIGLQYTKGLPADGYTIVQTSISPMTVNPVVMKDLPYDPVNDFKPLYGMARGMNVIVVANDSRFKTFADLIAAGKGGKPLSVGTFSAGYYIAAEWLATEAGIKIANIPYKGQGLIMTDLMGKQLDFALVDLGGAVPLITAGRIRALAVSGETRHADFPNVPAVNETYPHYVQYSWNSFYVRSQTPDDIAAVLARELRSAMATPEGKDLMKTSGMEYVALPPAEMQRFARDELERFKRIAKTAGIQPE